MTTPEKKEAEKRVIEAAMFKFTHDSREMYFAPSAYHSGDELIGFYLDDAGHLQYILRKSLYGLHSINAHNNALSTPVESLPEKVEEWEGWDALECKWGCCQIVQFRQSKFLRTTRAGGGWTAWATTEMSTDASHVNGWTKSPARLQILQSIADELVKAAKGVMV